MKLLMLGHFCLVELDLVNKIQFTFEVVPCLILGLYRRFFRRCVSILSQRYERMSGWEEGWGGRRKSPQVKTQGHT